MYVVCLLFYAIGRFLFVTMFVFLLSRSARKHRSERDDLFILPLVGSVALAVQPCSANTTGNAQQKDCCRFLGFVYALYRQNNFADYKA